jgi:RNA polymerase sigma factor (sigma-70 family)
MRVTPQQPTPEEAAEAARIAARNALVESCKRLAYKLCCEFWHASGYAKRHVPIDDMKQTALLALVMAADRFKPELGWKFSTYACNYIKLMLITFVKNQGVVRPPTGFKLAECAEFSSKNVQYPINDEGKPLEFLDYRAGDLDAELDDADMIGRVRQFVADMPWLMRTILLRRYLTQDNAPSTRELVRDLKVSRETIRQHERAGLWLVMRHFNVPGTPAERPKWKRSGWRKRKKKVQNTGRKLVVAS